MKPKILLRLLLLLGIQKVAVADYPAAVKEIRYLSAADNSEQPALFYAPEDQSRPVPLLVVLHTWSGDYRQKGSQVPMADWCLQQGWAFIHPNFRGQNWTPEALGSDLAVGDIISAVDYAKKTVSVDEKRIYCIGVSGGGHASMLMAGRAPEIWAGVSAWCGISDIAKWYEQCSGSSYKRYAEHIEKALGGVPSDFAEDAANRSPNTWLTKNRDKLPPLDIWHGINDGREIDEEMAAQIEQGTEKPRISGSVPFTHSLRAWNAAVGEENELSDEFLQNSFQTREFPESDLPAFGDRDVHFQKQAGNIRVSIFDGGHEILPEPALNWLAVQVKGEAPKWNAAPVAKLKVKKQQTESGK